MRRLWPILFLVAGVLSCSDEDRRGLDIDIPTDIGIKWHYELHSYYDDDSEKVGSLVSENFEVTNYQFRNDVLRQRRTRRLDALQETPDSVRLSSIYLDLSEDFEIHAYLDDFYRLFDTALTPQVLDTLTSGAQQTGAHNLTRFQNYEPGWSLVTRFDSRSSRSYEILDTETFDVAFRLRGNDLEGTVDVRVTGLFDGAGNINTLWRDNIYAYRIRTTVAFDFDLVKNDSITIPTFRETMDIIDWYNPDGGLVQRDRRPFTLTVPTIPSRGPAIVDWGERWILTGIEGMDF